MDKREISEILLEIYRSCPDNRVEDMPEVRIFDEPIMGIAAADDPIFKTYKSPEIIGPWHMLPSQWLHGARSVVSFFFPFSEDLRKSNRPGGQDISYQWVYGRVEGQGLINRIIARLAKTLGDSGIACTLPAEDGRFRSVTGGRGGLLHESAGEDTFSSNWSERHAAYACGLGTFGLSKGLITEKGMAGRFASIIVDAELEITERPYTQVYEYCSRCGACVRRCPVNAISLENGKSHVICNQWIQETMRRYAPRYGCGKCQTAVPCEFGKPKKD